MQSIAPVEGEEPDVAAERERLLSSSSNEDMVRLENLTKIYRRRTGLQGKHLAVHRLCLGVPKGEVGIDLVHVFLFFCVFLLK